RPSKREVECSAKASAERRRRAFTVARLKPSRYVVRRMQTFTFWILFLAGVGAFAAQVSHRVRIVAAGPNSFSTDNLPFRINRFVFDVILQRRTIRERPVAGLMHALVFWGFVAFAGYTSVEFLYGLGLVDLAHTAWFGGYRQALVPFASGVLIGILYLL